MSSPKISAIEKSNRFKLLRKLGQGGMGAVYLAHDQQMDSDVAIKLLPNVDPDALYQFKREFRSLTEIVHPNLVSLYELISTDNQWYFTMEFVEGCHFRDYVRGLIDKGDRETDMWLETTILPAASKPSDDEEEALTQDFSLVGISGDWDRVRHLFLQLAVGLHALHQRGKIHRDIKSSNVLVRPNGQVAILDFGLIADLEKRQDHISTLTAPKSGSLDDDSESPSDRRIVGTLHYMSPEQAAVETLTEATDWYSFGVMLFEALTGSYPFQGNVYQVLDLKCRQAAPPVGTRVRGVPDDLSQLCDRLLAQSPDARPKFDEILAVLTSSQQTAEIDNEAVDSFLCVGRDESLQQLRAAFKKMLTGETTLVSISGRSGFGKSTLVEHFLGEIQTASPVVLSGRCYEQESVPFKTLDSLVDSIVQHLSHRPEAEVAKIVPRHARELARLFPVLNQIPSIQNARSSQQARSAQDIRHLGFLALAELIRRLGDLHPLVIYIDDLQWGDNESGEAFRQLFLTDDMGRLLFISSHRSEHGLPNAFQEIFDEIDREETVSREQIEIGPLTEIHCRSVIAELAGQIQFNELTISRIIEDSQGNPLFLQELMRHHTNVEATGKPTGRLDDIIQHRVGSLNADERCLVELLSIAGKPMAVVDLLDSLPNMNDPYRVFAKLRSVRLVRGATLQRQTGVEVYHDRIRESVNAGLSLETAQSHHLALATTLLKHSDPDAETIALHLDGGGKQKDAGEWYARAGEKATTAFAFEHAAQLFEKSLQVRPLQGKEEGKLRLQLAEAYANAGRGRRSSEQYLRVAANSEASDRLNLQARAASQLCISGHIDLGLETFADVLKSYNIPLRTTRTAIITDLLWQRTKLWWRGIRFQKRHDNEIPEAQRQRLDNIWGIASGVSTVNNLSSAALQSRLLCECLKSGDVYRIVRSLAWEAFLTSASGDFPKAKRQLEQADQLLDSCDHPHARGMCMLARAMIEFQEARFLESVKTFVEAETYFDQALVGSWWETGTIRWIRGTALLHAGELAQISNFANEEFRLAKNRGDLFASTNMQAYLLPYLEIAQGNLETAHDYIVKARQKWNHSGFHYQHLQSKVIEIFLHLMEGRRLQAFELVETMWPEMNQALVLHNKLVRVMMLDMRATCALAASEDDPSYLPCAVKYGRALLREKDAWSSAFAHRILGGVSRRQGALDAARQHWEIAVREFENHSMKLHTAATQLALAEITPRQQQEQLQSLAIKTFEAENVTDWRRFSTCLTWRDLSPGHTK